jgi:colanic acid/amylovoran biosynthesis protein
VINILLINIHSSRNSGDAALMQATLLQLRRNFPGCCITLGMDDPDHNINDVEIVDSISAWVKSTSEVGSTSWRVLNLLLLPFSTLMPLLTFRLFGKPLYILTPTGLRATIDAYLKSDIVVSAPGGFMYSSGSGLVLSISVYTQVIAWLAGKPIYIFPQSFGPLAHRWEGWMLNWILSKARIVMVREFISMKLLKRNRFRHPDLHLLPDTAFTFPGAKASLATDWLVEHGIDPPTKHPLLGMTVINWGAQNPNFNRQSNYESACAKAIRQFVIQFNGKAILFPQVIGPSSDNDDRIPAGRIKMILNDISDSVLFIEEQLPPELIKALFGQMDVLIGTRMHSLIFALAEGVPVIAIGYLHKTQGLAAMIGLDRWVVDIREIQEQMLVEKLSLLWNERATIKAQISSALPKLIEQANQAGILCAKDYSSLLKARQRG